MKRPQIHPHANPNHFHSAPLSTPNKCQYSFTYANIQYPRLLRGSVNSLKLEWSVNMYMSAIFTRRAFSFQWILKVVILWKKLSPFLAHHSIALICTSNLMLFFFSFLLNHYSNSSINTSQFVYPSLWNSISQCKWWLWECALLHITITITVLGTAVIVV